MLYVLIMYCSGICPDRLPGPDGSLLFTSLKDCQEVRDSLPPPKSIADENGKPMKNTHQKMKCAHLYADPKQLDRLYHLPLPAK